MHHSMLRLISAGTPRRQITRTKDGECAVCLSGDRNRIIFHRWKSPSSTFSVNISSCTAATVRF